MKATWWDAALGDSTRKIYLYRVPIHSYIYFYNVRMDEFYPILYCESYFLFLQILDNGGFFFEWPLCGRRSAIVGYLFNGMAVPMRVSFSCLKKKIYILRGNLVWNLLQNFHDDRLIIQGRSTGALCFFYITAIMLPAWLILEMI